MVERAPIRMRNIVLFAMVAACAKHDDAGLLVSPCTDYWTRAADYCGGVTNIAEGFCDSITGASMWPPQCKPGKGPGDADNDNIPEHEVP